MLKEKHWLNFPEGEITYVNVAMSETGTVSSDKGLLHLVITVCM